jgi:hypothetical protein
VNDRFASPSDRRRGEGGEDLLDRRVVGAVAIHVRVADARTRSHDEGGPELGHPLAGRVYAVPAPVGSPRRAPGGRVEQPVPRYLGNRRCSRGATVVVDEHEVGDALVGDEALCVGEVAGADGHDLAPPRADRLVVPPQLGSVLAAVQSAEVAEKDQHHGPIPPEGIEAVRGAVGTRQTERPQRDRIHRSFP